MIIPIWQDTFYEYATNGVISNLSYYIAKEDTNTLQGNQIIFYGKAWGKPNSESIKINLNQVCRDYISSELPDLRQITGTTTYTHTDTINRFILFDSNSKPLWDNKFIMDWSYEYKNYNNKPLRMSKPINGKATNGMLFFYTYLDTDEKVKTVITPSITDINNSARDNLYHIENVCNSKYAVYYLDRNGGWNSYLIEGRVVKKDTYKKYYIDKTYDNTSIDFGRVVYHNEIITSYELHTGWLKDSESENLAFNLIPSNKIYLHNLEDNTIEPVIINNSDVTYKTFKNQGNKLYNYTLNIECSQKQHNL